MIEGLKPYPAYKESAHEWLGKVPEHWKTPRIKTVLREKDARSTDGSGLLLSLTRNRGLITRSDMTDKVHSARTLAGYKLYEPGEIVMNRMQAWSGMFGAGNNPGLVSPDYAVFTILGENHVSLLLARIKAPDLVSQFASESKGIGTGFNRLYSDKLGAIAISLPPPDEQLAIVRFLDHANRKIDGFIRAKRKLIGLLNEQKQAIIHRAVTRGLDPNAKLKPSGIPWLGEIPAHWEARQLRRVCRRVKTGGTPKGADERFYAFGGFNWHTPSDFRDAIELGDASRQLSNLGVQEVTTFPADTILMIGIGATIGKVSISRKACSCNQQINAIIANKRLIHLDYLVFYLRTLRGFILNCGKFTTMPIINQDETKRLPVLIPPVPEQVEIAKHIEQTSRPFATAIARTEREIALMQEYRTRLTADIVTGKLDVREAAAKLPEEKLEEVAEANFSEDETELEEADA